MGSRSSNSSGLVTSFVFKHNPIHTTFRLRPSCILQKIKDRNRGDYKECKWRLNAKNNGVKECT